MLVVSVLAQVSRGDVVRELHQFVDVWSSRIQTWKDNNQGHTESTAAQQFWGHLLRCFGVIPERIDLFERDAVRATTGNTGYIDLFWSSVAIGEAKSLGKDLVKAESQALDYLAGGSIASHEWPKFVITTNFETIRLTKLGDEGWTEQFPLEELAYHVDQLMFLAGREEVTKTEETNASIAASRLMADLFTAMTSTEVDESVGDEAPTNPEDEDWQVQKSSVFLTRVLFLLYGDDAGLWENDLFYRFILNDTNDENLGGQLTTLFQVLNTPENRRNRVPDSMARFPYVNGSLFDESWPQEFFDHDMRQALLNACRFNWTRISPAIFGSMFQLVKSKEARRPNGEHYTSETNILKVIEPLFLNGLRKEANRLIGNRSTTVKALRAFRDSLADMAFCDPACGCGNFLVVAYRELRKIETDIIVAIREREGLGDFSLDASWEQKLSIGQFYGFELNWWPAKIAETAMFLVDHQANRELALRIGDAPERLPIEITAHIIHGNALHLDWHKDLPAVPGDTYIFGNPPFIGARRMSAEQKSDLINAWNNLKGSKQLDYVTGWHAKALSFFTNRSGEFSFVATNSIVQGAPVSTLFSQIFERHWKVKFAHQTFEWDSEAPGKAAVHCVIVGFTRNSKVHPRLWKYPTVTSDAIEIHVERGINAYLFDGPNVLVTTRTNTALSPELTPAVNGSMSNAANYLVPKAGTPKPTDDPIAMKYVRRFIGARELIHGTDRWCYWMAGDDFSPSDIRRSPVLKECVSAVEELRGKSDREATVELAKTPHLFAERRQPEVAYLAIPRHVGQSVKYFPAQRFPADVICGDANFQMRDEDGLRFSIISSSMFMAWQQAIGGRIKSDFRFSNTLIWTSFPLPKLDETTRQKIIKGGQLVLAARELHPERSLAEHYNPLAMDPDLLKAHDKLDKAVDKAFGAPRKLTNEKQRQELLFQNYVKLTQE